MSGDLGSQSISLGDKTPPPSSARRSRRLSRVEVLTAVNEGEGDSSEYEDEEMHTAQGKEVLRRTEVEQAGVATRLAAAAAT